MHELVTEDGVQALHEKVAQDPESVNQLNEAGLPPLYTAALYYNQKAIDFLLAHGAAVRGVTALMQACHAGPWKDKLAEEVIQLLLDHDAQVDLFQAAAIGRTDLIEEILQSGRRAD